MAEPLLPAPQNPVSSAPPYPCDNCGHFNQFSELACARCGIMPDYSLSKPEPVSLQKKVNRPASLFWGTISLVVGSMLLVMSSSPVWIIALYLFVIGIIYLLQAIFLNTEILSTKPGKPGESGYRAYDPDD